MWWLCILVASSLAGNLDPAGHIDVTLADPDKGLLQSGEAWLRTADDCLAASLDDGRISVSICGGAINSEPVTCSADMDVGAEWTNWWHASCERPDGRMWGTSYGSSRHGVPSLVEHTDKLALWRATYALQASPQFETREVADCKSGQEQRTCNTSTGMSIWAVPVQSQRGVGVGVNKLSKPVNCKEACPPNPDLDKVHEANALLQDRVFSAADLRAAAALYATQAECQLAPATLVQIPQDVCIDPEA